MHRHCLFQIGTIWIWDFARHALTRFTAGPENGTNPVWTRDGQRIAFFSIRAGSPAVVVQRADGAGAVEQLATRPDMQLPKAAVPDGKSILTVGPGDGVGLVSLDRRSDTRMLLDALRTVNNPDVSPDGRWLAYESDESGVNEVYVRPFPNVNDGRWQVSTAGGVQPVWARNGGELFYLDGDGTAFSRPLRFRKPPRSTPADR